MDYFLMTHTTISGDSNGPGAAVAITFGLFPSSQRSEMCSY